MVAYHGANVVVTGGTGALGSAVVGAAGLTGIGALMRCKQGVRGTRAGANFMALQ